MPEIKNTFLKGKMNKDLDDRLIPQGEYIDALNVQITKSDGNNVGVIHNVKGNTQKSLFSPAGDSPELIGSFFDDKNNRAFWFVTDGGVNNYIYMYDFTGNGTPYTLVSGAFLKFSKSNKITGVNVLEDFLLWTDNLNQPRRINIDTAITTPGYYTSEVKISVAKYAPYLAPIIVSGDANTGNDRSVKSKRIQEEFVRFGYRYKFKYNEYSILSPFTPIIFKMEDNTISTTSNFYSTSELREVGASTELPVMINNINKVTMRIPLPSGSPGAKEGFEIEKIDILYKESDSTAIRIIETIDVTDNNTSGFQEYIYNSTNFKATLPEDQLTRVYDNVPYKALAQEVAGNRVIYGNVELGNNLPDIKFRVLNSAKQTANTALAHHSVKQRRAYEVGIVLSDIFGRTSPVITSEYSTIYVGAKAADFDNSSFNGDSLKIVFESITDDDSTIYNASTNPLGWYSYKVVVKQREQEYYNAYVPGVFYYSNQLKSYFVIHGDNINKIPRTSENRDDQDDFSSSQVRVYPKVLNISTGVGETFQNSYRNSDFRLLDITDIGKLSNHNLSSDAYIYESTKDHLVGKVSTQLGTLYNNIVKYGDFACFETEPFESSLDIYYETPTGGLISEIQSNLNDIQVNTNDPFSLSKTSITTTFNPSESAVRGEKVANIYGVSTNSGRISGYLTEFSVVSQSVADRFEFKFDESEGEWGVYVKTPFRWTNTNNTIVVSMKFLGVEYAGGGGDTIIADLQNVAPSITLSSNNVTYSVRNDSNDDAGSETLGDVTEDSLIMKLYGVNGASVENKIGLTFSGTIRDVSQGEQTFSDISTYQIDGVNVTDYIEIINGKDFVNGELLPDAVPGTALLNYHASTANGGFTSSLVNQDHVFELKFRCSDSNLNSTEELVTITVISDPPSSANFYHASFDAYENAYEACQDPIGSLNWSLVTVYYSGDDPFVVDAPNRMYKDRSLSIPATSGWYKRTDTGIVGRYFISGNEPADFSGWWNDTPVACAGLSEADAQSSVTYNPKDTTTTEENTGENPYDLPTDDQTPIP